QRWIMRSHDYVRIAPSSETDNPIKMKKLKYYAMGFLITLFVVIVVLPFLSVIAYTESFANIWQTLRSFSDCIATTSLLALLAAVISTAIAFFIGDYLVHNRNRFSGILDTLCWLPIAIPGTIIGLGLIKLSNNIPVLHRDSFGVLLLCAYVGMFSAFSIRIFEAANRRADPNVAEAAAMDCCRWYQRLLHIDMPIHSGAIAVSMIIVFVLVLGELNATVLLIPPGKATLAVSIDNLLHYGASATASVLCLIEAGLVIIAIVCALFVLRVSRKILK
ncbi:MAG: iron ABC transporter permease, partial [Planctomycetes bacterium]|nr:iron ABC transporter permease [Planctomycetota bacterium]